MKVLGIDPGLRNMAYCFMVEGKIRCLERVDIFDGHEIVVKDTFDRAMKFMDDIKDLTDEADVVLVEKQFADNKLALSTCLIVIQTVIQCICRTKCVVVHALAIKRVYGTSMGEYRLNKQAAIRKAIEICPDILSLFPKKKIDDISDAFLLSHFGTYHLGSVFSKGKVSCVSLNNDNGREREHRPVQSERDCDRTSYLAAKRKRDARSPDPGTDSAPTEISEKEHVSEGDASSPSTSSE